MSSRAGICIECWRPEPIGLTGDIRMLADVLHACVPAGASVSFILPFSKEEAAAFWLDQIAPAVRAGTGCLLVARLAGRIVGTVHLDLSTPPNQAHRAEVKKLLVHPDVRRRGIARALMAAVEEQAHEAGRNLRTLDTRTGDSAEPLYLSMGYISAGVIPGYARRPNSSALDATTLMYKTLSKPVAAAKRPAW